jgi:hypothetical protein
MYDRRSHSDQLIADRARRRNSFTPVKPPWCYPWFVRILESLATRRPDPLRVTTDLPLTGRYHPLGFDLEIATNSRDILAAAEEAWAGVAREFDGAPLRIRAVVSSDGPLAGESRHSKHDHLYSIVSDAHNFAQADLRCCLAVVHVSQATASDHAWLRWFFLESLAYIMLCQRHVVMIHAACVARNGSGVLLCGPSMAGKSTLSYACARAGWTWLADDCTCLLPGSPERAAIARSLVARFRVDAPALFPELEAFAARARPTGKIGLEVPMPDVPGIRTARRLPIGAIAFLDRAAGPASIGPVGRDEALDRLLADMPQYGPDVDPIHERVAAAVAEAPAYTLRYETIEDGVRLLSTL